MDPTQGKCVLVVEDDDDLREALVEVIGSWGFCVCQARNGEEALEQVERFTPSLVLLDLMMPLINGWEFLRIAEQEYRSLKVIIITAVHPDDVPASYPVLQKPMPLEDVRLAVERACHA